MQSTRPEDDQDAGDSVDGRAAGGTSQQIAASFDLLLETATTQTRKLGEFTIPGVGKLVEAHRAAPMGRDPATGKAMKIKAKTTVN